MVDNTQTVRGCFTYDPYGSLTRISGLDCDFGYSGHNYEPHSRLHLAAYRAYDAEIGRWISEDPIGENGGMNLYAYIGSSPVNGVDLFGLSWLDCLPDNVLHVLGSQELRSFNNYAAGSTDSLSCGFSKYLRDTAYGEHNNGVDECDPAYVIGEIVGMVIDPLAAGEKAAVKMGEEAACKLGCFSEGK